MIAHLRGKLVNKLSESLIIDVNGVGYEVYFSKLHHDRLPELDDDVFLYIYTVVREDAFNLYGFIRQQEKRMFTLLMGVSGIGPKLGLNILAGISPHTLTKAISAEDISRLTRVSGVGKKTAERLCLELKDKVRFVVETESDDSTVLPSVDTVSDKRAADALSALVNLGYSEVKAKDALCMVQQQAGAKKYMAMGLSELLRHALRSFS